MPMAFKLFVTFMLIMLGLTLYDQYQPDVNWNILGMGFMLLLQLTVLLLVYAVAHGLMQSAKVEKHLHARIDELEKRLDDNEY